MLQVVQAFLEPAVASPVVVVYRRTESVELRSLAVEDDLAAVVFHTIDCTFAVVKLQREAVARHGGEVFGFLYRRTLHRSCHRRQGRLLAGSLHGQLLFHLHEALLGPRHILTQQELNLHKVFAFGGQLAVVVGQGVSHLLARAEDVARTLEGGAFLYLLPVFPQGPYHIDIGQRLEVALVEDFNLALRHVYCLDAHVLIDLLHFIVLGLGLMAGEEDAVHAEHAAVGLVAEVASVGQVAVARLRVVVVECLVHPVPNGGSTEEVGRLDSFPVVDEVAHGVAHRVGIFGYVEGVLDVVLARHGTAHPRDGGILVGAHVHDVVVALVLNGARGVELMEGVVGRHEVLARSGLVAQRPDDHGRMVDVRMCQLHDAGHVGCLELGHVRQGGVAVVVFVAFEVGLIFQIDAILVAEVVPVRIIGIVRVAHVVDVAALHQHDFLFHLLHRDGVARSRIDFLTVHALQLHRLSINIIVASGQSELVFAGRRILDFDLAETQGGGERLHHAALLVLQLTHQYITIGSLGRPLAGSVNGHHGLRGNLVTRLHLGQRISAIHAFHQLILI